VPKTDRKLAAKPSIVTRVKEIQAENEAECRWGRKQLLDFYRDCFERGAGTLAADDRLPRRQGDNCARTFVSEITDSGLKERMLVLCYAGEICHWDNLAWAVLATLPLGDKSERLAPLGRV
jgi:hypothetical protein